MRAKYGGLLAIACTLALAGCESLLGVGGPVIVVSLGMQGTVEAPLFLRADIGGRQVEVQSRILGDDRAFTEGHGPRYGEVPVRATVLSASRQELATVSFTQEFRRGNRHWLSALVGQQRPEGFCIGAVAAAPLRTGGADSLFVMYGGMPEDAVC